MFLMFSSEICGNFSQFRRFPFYYFRGVSVIFQPLFGAVNEFEQFFCLCVALKFGATLFLFHPKNGISAVGINRHVQSFLLQESKRMDYGKKLAYIVCSPNRTVMKNFCFLRDISKSFGYLLLCFLGKRNSKKCSLFTFCRRPHFFVFMLVTFFPASQCREVSCLRL